MLTYIVEFLNDQAKWIPFQKFYRLQLAVDLAREFDGVFRILKQSKLEEEIEIK